MSYIHCLPCGRELKNGTGAKEPGEHSWYVQGFAKHHMLCDSCHKRISKGEKCQATTFYTDETGYGPWEGEFLERMEEGTSGVERSFKESTPTMKVLTVLACRGGDDDFLWKIPEVEMSGHVYGDFETLYEQIHDQFSCHDWLGKEFEQDLKERGGNYSFDIHLVVAAEFGPARGDEVWEE